MDEKRSTLREVKQKTKQLVFLGAFWALIAPGLVVAWVRYTRGLAKKSKGDL